MAEQGSPATPPATSGGTPPFDYEALSKAISTQIAAALKPLSDQIGKLATPTPPAAKQEVPAAGALSLADVAKLLDERDAKSATTGQQKAARDAFLADKLKDLPAAYQAQLGSDPSQWATEEQNIRTGFKADIAKLGYKPNDLSGVPAQAAGAKPIDATQLDVSKLNPVQQIELGLKQAAAK